MTKPVDNGKEYATLARSDFTVEARVVRLDTARSTPPVGMDKDRRRSIRLPVDHSIRCHYGTGEAGTARLCNVGRSGVSARSGRYLRPGTRVMLEVGPRRAGGSEELKAEVAWCRPARDSDEFLTGLRVYHDETRALGALSALMFDGLDRLGADQRDSRRGKGQGHSGCGCGPRVFLKAYITSAAPAWHESVWQAV
jgi:PilZ domain